MTGVDHKALAKSGQATVKRLNAENTWLRHTFMEMEARVAAMQSQLTELEARAKALKQSIANPPANPPAKSPSKSRSKK
jgi:phage shock protein A